MADRKLIEESNKGKSLLARLGHELNPDCWCEPTVEVVEGKNA